MLSEAIQDACTFVDTVRASAPVVLQSIQTNVPKLTRATVDGAKQLYRIAMPDKSYRLRFDFAYFQSVSVAQILSVCAANFSIIQFAQSSERFYISVNDLADILLTSQEVYSGTGFEDCFIVLHFKENHQFDPDKDFELVPYDVT